MIKTDKLNILSISFGSLTIHIHDVGGTPSLGAVRLCPMYGF